MKVIVSYVMSVTATQYRTCSVRSAWCTLLLVTALPSCTCQELVLKRDCSNNLMHACAAQQFKLFEGSCFHGDQYTNKMASPVLDVMLMTGKSEEKRSSGQGNERTTWWLRLK